MTFHEIRRNLAQQWCKLEPVTVACAEDDEAPISANNKFFARSFRSGLYREVEFRLEISKGTKNLLHRAAIRPRDENVNIGSDVHCRVIEVAREKIHPLEDDRRHACGAHLLNRFHGSALLHPPYEVVKPLCWCIDRPDAQVVQAVDSRLLEIREMRWRKCDHFGLDIWIKPQAVSARCQQSQSRLPPVCRHALPRY